MDNRQRRTLRAFARIVGNLQSHPIAPEPPMLAGKRKALAASVDRLRALSQEQHNAQLDLRGDISLRTNKLRRERMIPLSKIAKPALAYAPGAERALRVPHARSSTAVVATAALRMLDVLTPHTKLLRAAGVSREFLQRFRAEAKQLALQAKTTRDARQRLTRATAAIEAELRKGRRTAGILEGLVMLHAGHDETFMKMWKHERRVGKRIGRPKKRRSAAGQGPASTLQPLHP